MLVDMHIHSNYSFDSKIKLSDLLKHLKEIGLDGIVITDHDSIEGNSKAENMQRDK